MSRLLLKTNTDSLVTVTKSLIQKIPVKVPVLAGPAPKVVKMQAESVAVKMIYVYKDEAKKELPPKDIQDAPQQRVISTSTVSLDEHSQVITTLLASTAGESPALVQTEPPLGLLLTIREMHLLTSCRNSAARCKDRGEAGFSSTEGDAFPHHGRWRCAGADYGHGRQGECICR